MKKVWFIIFSLFSLNAFALQVNIGASLQSATYSSTNSTIDLLQGKGAQSYKTPIYAINAEVTQEILIGAIGAGASYEQGYERQDGETFNAIPIYGILRLDIFSLYINAKYGTTLYTGVSDPTTKYEGGQYLSFGVGISLAGLQIEGSATANTAQRNGADIGTAAYGLTARYSTN